MELLVALCLGLGLSASCGFRVFVPLLAMSLAAKAGFVTPSGGFEWLGTWPAVITFGVACLAEVGGYYVPWIDNALDTVATPAAIAAGAILTASQLGDVHPLLQYGGGLVAGGGIAGTIQTATVAARGTTSVTTGGLGNAIFATIENVIGSVLAFLAIAIPVVAGFLLLCVIGLVAFVLLRRRAARRAVALAA